MKQGLKVRDNTNNDLSNDYYTPHLDSLKEILLRGYIINDHEKGILDTALIWAIDNGDIELVKELIHCKADVNYTAKNGRTPLMFAAKIGDADIVKLLLVNGAKVNYAEKKEGNTALIVATVEGHINVVEELIIAKADIKQNDNCGYSALFYAVAKGHIAIVRRYIELGVDINAASMILGDTPLITSVVKGQIKAAEELLANGADVNQVNRLNGQTPLIYASLMEDDSIAELLISKGANLNMASTWSGETPLLSATKMRHVNIVKALLARGADANQANEITGNTPLIEAISKQVKDLFTDLYKEATANTSLSSEENSEEKTVILAERRKQIEIINLLVDAGADLNRVNPITGEPPIIYALNNLQIEILDLLTQKGADLDLIQPKSFISNLLFGLTISQEYMGLMKLLIDKEIVDVNTIFPIAGDTPLIQAINRGQLKVVKVLIAHGADVNLKNSSGVTPLDVAAREGHLEVVKLLIANGADINKESDNFWINTALMSAASAGHSNVVQLLLSHSSDVNRMNLNGYSALTEAIESERIDIVKLLITAGANVNLRNIHDGNTPLIYALLTRNAEIVKELLELGAEVNTANSIDGNTPLIYASLMGEDFIANLLISKGADLSLSNTNSGDTPLLSAVNKRYVDVVKKLLASGANANQANEITGNTPLIEAIKNVVKEPISKFWDTISAETSKVLTSIASGRAISERKKQDEIINSLIDAGADLDSSNLKNGISPLSCAIESESIDIIQLLIEKGADVTHIKDLTYSLFAQTINNEKTHLLKKIIDKGLYVDTVNGNDGFTPLLQAIHKGSFAAVKFLTAGKADVNLANKVSGETPLIAAVRKGSIKIVKELLVGGTDINQANKLDGNTPLIVAISKRNIEMLKLLLAWEADVEQINWRTGESPLIYALEEKSSIDIIKALVEAGADVDEVNGIMELTPLILAVAYSYDAAKLLIENDADVNYYNPDDESCAMNCAITNGRKDIVELLLDNGAYLNYFSPDHDASPLKCALIAERIEIVELLLQKGANVDPIKSQSSLVFCKAINHGHIELIKILIDRGLDVNDFNEKDGSTPLLWAAEKGCVEVVKELLARGANIDQMNEKNGYTPLILAVQNDHIELVKLLLDKGAAPNQAENEGYTPLLLAVSGEHVEVVKELLARGACVDQVHEHTRRSPLMLAVTNGNVEIVKELLAKGANPNEVDENTGYTPLLSAARKGHIDIVKELLSKGASVNQVNKKSGDSVLTIAAYGGHLELIRELISSGIDVNLRDSYKNTPLLSLIHDKSWRNKHSQQMDSNSSNSIDDYEYKSIIKELLKTFKVDLRPEGRDAIQEAKAYGLEEIFETLSIYRSFYEMMVEGKFPSLLENVRSDDGLKFIEELAVAYYLKDPIKFSESALKQYVQILDINGKRTKVVVIEKFREYYNNKTIFNIKKALIREKINTKLTPLHYAAYSGEESTVRMLLDKGVDINAQDKQGKTPLHYAAIAGHSKVLSILYRAGANTEIKDLTGATPLQIALESKKSLLVKAAKKIIKETSKQFSATQESDFRKALDNSLTVEEHKQLAGHYGAEFIDRFSLNRIKELQSLIKVLGMSNVLSLSKANFQKLIENPLIIELLQAKYFSMDDVISAIDSFISEANLLSQKVAKVSTSYIAFVMKARGGVLTYKDFVETDGEVLKHAFNEVLSRGYTECFINMLDYYKAQAFVLAKDIFGQAIKYGRQLEFEELSKKISLRGQPIIIYSLLELAIPKEDMSFFKLLAETYADELSAEQKFSLIDYAYNITREGRSQDKAFTRSIFELLAPREFVDTTIEELNALRVKADKNPYIFNLIKTYADKLGLSLSNIPPKHSKPSNISTVEFEKGEWAPTKVVSLERHEVTDKASSKKEKKKLEELSKAPYTPYLDNSLVPRKEAATVDKETLDKLKNIPLDAPFIGEGVQRELVVTKTMKSKFKLSQEQLDYLNTAKVLAISIGDYYDKVLELKKGSTSSNELHEYIYSLRYSVLRLAESLSHFKDQPEAIAFNNIISERILDINAARQIRDSVRHNFSLLENQNKLLRLCKALMKENDIAKLIKAVISKQSSGFESKAIKLPPDIYGFYVSDHKYNDTELVSFIKKELTNIEAFYRPYNPKCHQDTPEKLKKFDFEGGVSKEAIKMSICTIGIYIKALSEHHPLKHQLYHFTKLGNKTAHEVMDSDSEMIRFVKPLVKSVPKTATLQEIFEVSHKDSLQELLESHAEVKRNDYSIEEFSTESMLNIINQLDGMKVIVDRAKNYKPYSGNETGVDVASNVMLKPGDDPHLPEYYIKPGKEEVEFVGLSQDNYNNDQV
jgi:ankyrin repeat protein